MSGRRDQVPAMVGRGVVFLLSLAVALAAAPAQQPNRATASMLINSTDGPVYPMNVDVRTSTVATMTWQGIPGMAFIVARSALGGLQAGAAVIGSEYLDLPLLPAYEIIADGTVDATFRIPSTGLFTLPVVVPDVGVAPTGIPLGHHEAFQSLVFDPTAAHGWHLTAATRVTVTQGPTVIALALGDEDVMQVNLPPGMTLPFYGTAYTSLTVSANGFINPGSNTQQDRVPGPYVVFGGPPRMMGFFCDLDQGLGTERCIIDANPPGGNPFVRVEFTQVGDYLTGGSHHTFSTQIDTDGNVDMTWSFACAASRFDTIIGITPGYWVDQHPKRDLLAVVAANGFASQTDYENFWDWYGITGIAMPNYAPSPFVDHPFNLTGASLHFTPIGPGTTLAATRRYYLY